MAQEQQRIQQLINLDNQTVNLTDQQVQQTLNFIKNHLMAFYEHYANERGITVATAASTINRWDKQQWLQAVREIDMQDWPNEAAKRVSVLGAIAGIDKSHLYGAIASLGIVSLTVKQLQTVRRRINLDTKTELSRMDNNFKLPSKSFNQLEQTINKSVTESAKTGWSPALWEQNDAMIADVQKMVTHAMQHGMTAKDIENLLASHDNSGQFKPSQSIDDRIERSQFNMRRLVRSESAMVKYHINLATYRKQGYAMVDWVTEPGACDTCQAIADDGPYSIDSAPEVVNDSHPNCRCSIVPYIDIGQHSIQ